MPWIPTNNAADVRAIITNLLAYFATNQVLALAWASPLRVLPPFTKFYPNAEVDATTDFPHFGILRRSVSIDNADGGLKIEYRLTFLIEELPVQHTLLTRATVLAQHQIDIDNRVYAVESMFMNIPNATLFANVNGTGHGYRSITTVEPIERAISNTQSLFVATIDALLQFTENPR